MLIVYRETTSFVVSISKSEWLDIKGNSATLKQNCCITGLSDGNSSKSKGRYVLSHSKRAYKYIRDFRETVEGATRLIRVRRIIAV
jgi:hypothetical protein